MTKNLEMSMAEQVTLYDRLRNQKKEIETTLKKLSESIKNYAALHGVKDDKGSYYVDDGTFVFGQSIRKSISLNAEKALAYCKSHNLQKCIVTKEEVDADALELLVTKGEVASKDIEGLTDIKVSYSVVVNRKEDMPVVEMSEIEVDKPTATKKPVIKRRKK